MLCYALAENVTDIVSGMRQMKEYERGKTMKVYTIKDIAAMAGVSVTTVSRVLNHRPDVNIATREKVEQIIRDCHFIGNTHTFSHISTDFCEYTRRRVNAEH